MSLLHSWRDVQLLDEIRLLRCVAHPLDTQKARRVRWRRLQRHWFQPSAIFNGEGRDHLFFVLQVWQAAQRMNVAVDAEQGPWQCERTPSPSLLTSPQSPKLSDKFALPRHCQGVLLQKLTSQLRRNKMHRRICKHIESGNLFSLECWKKGSIGQTSATFSQKISAGLRQLRKYFAMFCESTERHEVVYRFLLELNISSMTLCQIHELFNATHDSYISFSVFKNIVKVLGLKYAAKRVGFDNTQAAKNKRLHFAHVFLTKQLQAETKTFFLRNFAIGSIL